MWPYDYINPMIPYFEWAKQVAANVPQPGERGDYTMEMFQTDFPQFWQAYKEIGSEDEQYKLVLPESMLQMFVDQANNRVLPSRWGNMWR